MSNILDQLSYVYMLNYIKRRPLDINIETINFCPMKCVFCCNRLYARKYTVMNNTLFEKIIREYVKCGGGMWDWLYAVRLSFGSAFTTENKNIA